MREDRLHPDLVAYLRDQGWTGLTSAQEAALPPLLGGHHTLLVAPTGYGKTEAALLPVLSRLLAERDHLTGQAKAWPKGFKALYITPLRALNRDLLGRLESWGKALGLRIGVRHGDTPRAQRAAQSRNPPDLLITTPETVQLLLYGDTLRRHLRTVRFAILDEVHDLAASERGAQLAVALERIEEVVGQPEALAFTPAKQRVPPAPCARPGGGFQRIGLSATVADPAAVARFLGGRDPSTARAVDVVPVAGDKERRLHVVAPEVTDEDAASAGRLALPPSVMAQLRVVREIVQAHGKVLVFHNTRDGAEMLVNRSALLDEEAGAEPLLGLHHGSLSAEHRQDTEDAFKRGALRGLVATSSLELGIDVGAIDHVVQIGSPRSVARLVQRLGRAGHRVGAVSEGTLVATGAEDVLECMAVAQAALEGRLEPLCVREAPLVVFANQLVALINEYARLDRDWAWQVITRAAPFVDLDEGIFDSAWEALLDLKTLYPSDDAPGAFGRSGRARRHFLDHIGLIPDERTYRILDEATKRAIGTVDDSFVAAALHPGAAFIMAGRSWNVLEVEPEAQRVRVAPAKDLGAVPQWSGSQLPVSAMVAGAVARLRGRLARNGSLAGVPVSAATLEAATAPLHAQIKQGLQVPTESLVTLESGRDRMVVHVPLGTRGNEALGRITQALLHQRLGQTVGLESDAYRIHLGVRGGVSASDLEETWRSLDPDTLDLLLMRVLRDSPQVRHHLVHVAKHFGGLPKDMDPNRFSRQKVDALMSHFALQEETLGRLLHDRLDVAAVADWLREVQAGAVRFVHQGIGPLAHLGRDEMKRMMAPAADDALLGAVRERIEASDVRMLCTHCRQQWDSLVRLLPRRIHCRRCGSNQVACLRPWHDEARALLGQGGAKDKEARLERERILRNGALVASFGAIACKVLVARGVGPDTAARILQKVEDPASPHFWRELLQAELEFARTSAYWSR